jgi:hypothetical protein
VSTTTIYATTGSGYSLVGFASWSSPSSLADYPAIGGSSNFDVGCDNNGKRQILNQSFFTADASSLAGNTISASTFYLTVGPGGVTNTTSISAIKYGWTDGSSTIRKGNWRTPSQLSALSSYASGSITGGSSGDFAMTGSSALNTDLAGNVIKFAIVSADNISGASYSNKYANFYLPVSVNTFSQYPRVFVTYSAGGGGTTQTASTDAVTNSPSTASTALRTAITSATAVTTSPTVSAAANALFNASAATTTSPTSAASATVVRAVDAAVTTSPTSTASSSATRPVSATVTTTPSSDATATQTTAAKSADGALTTSPTTAATGVRVVTASATNVTVSPTTSATSVRVVVADSSTTITPSSSGQSAATRNAIAAYALTPSTAATVTVTRTVSATGVTVTTVTAALAIIADRRGFMGAGTASVANMIQTTTATAAMTATNKSTATMIETT